MISERKNKVKVFYTIVIFLFIVFWPTIKLIADSYTIGKNYKQFTYDIETQFSPGDTIEINGDATKGYVFSFQDPDGNVITTETVSPGGTLTFPEYQYAGGRAYKWETIYLAYYTGHINWNGSIFKVVFTDVTNDLLDQSVIYEQPATFSLNTIGDESLYDFKWYFVTDAIDVTDEIRYKTNFTKNANGSWVTDSGVTSADITYDLRFDEAYVVEVEYELNGGSLELLQQYNRYSLPEFKNGKYTVRYVLFERFDNLQIKYSCEDDVMHNAIIHSVKLYSREELNLSNNAKSITISPTSNANFYQDESYFMVDPYGEDDYMYLSRIAKLDIKQKTFYHPETDTTIELNDYVEPNYRFIAFTPPKRIFPNIRDDIIEFYDLGFEDKFGELVDLEKPPYKITFKITDNLSDFHKFDIVTWNAETGEILEVFEPVEEDGYLTITTDELLLFGIRGYHIENPKTSVKTYVVLGFVVMAFGMALYVKIRKNKITKI